jgi:polyhydroxyalkanoate synthesis regulator phasin
MSLIEMIRKSLLASLGAAVVTKEKVEAATQRLVEDGKISRDEAEKLANELVELQERVDNLEKRLAVLEKVTEE